MEFNLKDGDILEREYAEFIKNVLPNYIYVWKIYIGNDGTNTMALIENEKDEDNKKRKQFSEHSYTVLESICLLHRQLGKSVFNVPVKNFDQTLELKDRLFCFFAHFGRIRDNLKNAGEQLGVPNVEKRLDDFWYQRHIFIHGVTMPMRINEVDGTFSIPVLAKGTEDHTGFKLGSYWADINNYDLESLHDKTKNDFEFLVALVNVIYGNFLEKVKELLGGRQVSFDIKESGVASIYGMNSKQGETGYSGYSKPGKVGISGYGAVDPTTIFTSGTGNSGSSGDPTIKPK